MAQNSLKKQSTRAAGLQNWYESTAREAKAKAEAEAEAKRKKEEEEAKQRAEAEAKEKAYQEQVAKRKAEFAEKQKKAREEEVCHSTFCPSHNAIVDHLDYCPVICQHRGSKLMIRKRKICALITNSKQLTELSSAPDPCCWL